MKSLRIDFIENGVTVTEMGDKDNAIRAFTSAGELATFMQQVFTRHVSPPTEKEEAELERIYEQAKQEAARILREAEDKAEMARRSGVVAGMAKSRMGG